MTIDIDTMPAGPELDRLVCKAIGIEPLPGIYTYPMKRISDTVIEPDYDDERPVYPGVSTKPGPAMEVVEKMGEMDYWFSSSIMPLVNGTPVSITAEACFQKCPIMDRNPKHHAHAETFELAVCRAAYKAKMGEKQ